MRKLSMKGEKRFTKIFLKGDSVITSDLFYRRFDEGFEERALQNGLTRMRGKVSRWTLAHGAGPLQFEFRINPKASALPGIPVHFWPLVQWSGPRYSERDSGLVSWFQYTSEAENRSIQELRRRVLDKANRLEFCPDEAHRVLARSVLEMLYLELDDSLRPNHPQPSLFYFDEEDCMVWGEWFGGNLGEWLVRFGAMPETLETWCWRVLWKDLPDNPLSTA